MEREFIHRRGRECAELAQRSFRVINSADLRVLRSSAVKVFL